MITWTGAAAVAVAFGFGRYGYGLFLPEIRAAYGLDLAEAGMLAGAAYGAYVLAVLAAGLVAARLGPRIPVVLGIGAGVTGVAIVAAAHHPAMLAVGIALAGTSAGWVWAPYSDVVEAGVPEHGRQRALAVVSTGTCLGLVAAAPLALVAGENGWRLAWAAFALTGLAVTVVAALVLPRAKATTIRFRDVPTKGIAKLLAFGAVFSALGAVYFTYVVDLARAAGLPFEYGPLVYVVIGLVGLVAVATGGLSRAIGVDRLAVLAVAAMSGAGALLVVGRDSLGAVLASATVFGAAYMISAALLAIMAARVSPRRPSASLTAGMLVGAATATVAPPLVGMLPLA
jgi:predicted MFS family arabinose efflux permease